MGPNPDRAPSANNLRRRVLDIRHPMDLLNKQVQLKNVHKKDTCPTCGLKSYARMSDDDRRTHLMKHKRKALAA